MGDDKTIFSMIIDGEIPCHKVYEDDLVFAFLDINPFSPGHTLVVPKEPTRTIDKLSDESAEALGSDHVLNYNEVDFRKQVIEMYGKPHRRTHDGGVDVVVNFTGGDTWVNSFKCMKRGGRLLTCGATAGFDPKTDIRFIWTFELKICGSNSWTKQDLIDLMSYIQDGSMLPVIDTVLPLEDGAEGIRMIEDREVFGKIIIEP